MKKDTGFILITSLKVSLSFLKGGHHTYGVIGVISHTSPADPSTSSEQVAGLVDGFLVSPSSIRYL
jgi:hypothetical protein